MNRAVKFVAVVCMILSLPVGVNDKVDIREFGNTARYAKANAALGQPKQNEKRVVMFGNSIMECWQLRYPEFFERTGYICRGISGQTTYQFLLRFRQDVINLHPRVVIIGGPTNDIAENTCPYNEETTFGNIVTMVELARQNKIRVVLSAVLPSQKFPWSKATGVSPKIKLLNARLKAYAKQQKIPFADYYDAMLDSDGISQNKSYTTDDVHPNKSGYQVMEQILLPLVKKQL